MADIANKYAENVSGKFYVDDQCIDCDLCRETAPANFMRIDDGGYSYVFKQPTTPSRHPSRASVKAGSRCRGAGCFPLRSRRAFSHRCRNLENREDRGLSNGTCRPHLNDLPADSSASIFPAPSDALNCPPRWPEEPGVRARNLPPCGRRFPQGRSTLSESAGRFR